MIRKLYFHTGDSSPNAGGRGKVSGASGAYLEEITYTGQRNFVGDRYAEVTGDPYHEAEFARKREEAGA